MHELVGASMQPSLGGQHACVNTVKFADRLVWAHPHLHDLEYGPITISRAPRLITGTHDAAALGHVLGPRSDHEVANSGIGQQPGRVVGVLDAPECGRPLGAADD